MSVCIPTYTLGGVLTTYFGLSVGEALWAIFAANVIVLIPLILNAFGGTKFGIPFPVMLRSSFGMIGSNVPALIRALVACGWFGIQSLLGGIAVHQLLSAIFAGWAQLGGVGEVLGFLIFWVANVMVVIRGSESIKRLEAFAAPLLLCVGAGLLIWAWPQASMTELFAQPGNRPADASLPGYFFAGLTANGWLLGDLVAEHSGFQPLREVAEEPDRRPDHRSAADHGALRRAGSGFDGRLEAAGGRNRLRSHHADRTHRQPGLDRPLDDHHHHRDHLHQHRSEHRLAHERFFRTWLLVLSIRERVCCSPAFSGSH
jgi:hypothetical protein